MPATANWYGLGPQHLAKKRIDWEVMTMNVMLLADTYIPDQDTHDYVADIRANEITGTGYTANGALIANRLLSYQATDNTLQFQGDDVSWPSSTITARYAVVYGVGPTDDTDSPLLGYIDFGQNESSSASTFSIGWENGIVLQITAA